MRIVVVGGSGLAGSQTARALRDGGHEALAEDATGSPKGRARDLAGPEPQDFVDMAGRHPHHAPAEQAQ